MHGASKYSGRPWTSRTLGYMYFGAYIQDDVSALELSGLSLATTAWCYSFDFFMASAHERALTALLRALSTRARLIGVHFLLPPRCETAKPYGDDSQSRKNVFTLHVPKNPTPGAESTPIALKKSDHTTSLCTQLLQACPPASHTADIEYLCLTSVAEIPHDSSGSLGSFSCRLQHVRLGFEPILELSQPRRFVLPLGLCLLRPAVRGHGSTVCSLVVDMFGRKKDLQRHAFRCFSRRGRTSTS